MVKYMSIDVFQAIRVFDNQAVDYINNLNDINIVSEYGENLLHEAISCNNVNVAKLLIQKGINIDFQDNNGRTPIFYAVNHDNISMVRALLDEQCDLSIEDEFGNQVLWTAVMGARGEYSITKLLMEQKPDVNHINRAGRSPLDFAKQINDKELINILEQ